MNGIVLRFGPYENITPTGMDGILILFSFSKVDSRLFGSPAEHEASTLHRLIVNVAGGIDWAGDKAAFAKILFELGMPKIIAFMTATGDLPDEIPDSVPNQGRPLDPDFLGDIDGTIIEVELPSMRTRRRERK